MLGAIFLGIAVLGSFLGWSYWLRAALRTRENRELGRDLFGGAACVLLAGGLLNAFEQVSATANLAVLSAGWLGLVPELRPYLSRLKNQGSPRQLLWASLFTAFTLILGILVLSYFRGWFFSLSDDFYGYIVFPHKMLQLGSHGIEPFNTRRLSALGGNSYLLAIPLGFLPLRQITLIEPGLAIVMLAILVLGILRRRGVEGKWSAVALPFILFGAAFFPRSNTTSVILALGFVLLLLERYVQVAENGLETSQVLFVALCSAALSSLKGNVSMLPLALLGTVYGYRILGKLSARQSIAKDLREALLLLVCYSLFLFPWLHSAKGATGSWFFPLLGKGHHVTTYHDVEGLLKPDLDPKSLYSAFANITRFAPMLATIVLFCGLGVAKASSRMKLAFLGWAALIYLGVLTSFVKGLMVLLLIGVVAFGWTLRTRAPRWLKLAPIAIFSAWLCGFALYVSANGCSYQRFFYALSFGALLCLLVLAIEYLQKLNARGPWAATMLGCVFLIVATETSYDGFPTSPLDLPKRFALTLTAHASNIVTPKTDDPARDPVESGEPWFYAHLQAKFPVGKTTLVRLEAPYLLDFKRNHIWVVDMPGEASPAPGMPYQKGPEALAQYLRSVGVCAVAFSPSLLGSQTYMRNHYYKWMRANSRTVEDFQNNVMELKKTRPVLFDDGREVLIDLCGD